MRSVRPAGPSSPAQTSPAEANRPEADGPQTDGPSRPPRPSAWRILYGLYAWLEFMLASLATIGVLLCLRPLGRRRALVGHLARLALRLAGMRLRLGALDSLPSPCVVVANHSSYLDGVVLAAALPPSFSFVIKREMASVPLAGLLLRRIGVEFVERRAQAHLMRDTRRLLRHAVRGQALAFFPEGTFSNQVGLLRFHIGAFAAAARANLPVVPIAIRGTRHCLPPGSPWPQPGIIKVQALPVLPALPQQAHDHGAWAAELRDCARAALLAALGEPDLSPPTALSAQPGPSA